MKSLSEIETTVKRATKASGYSWGVAEETAKCVRLLESFGLPGIKHINKYFSERKENSFQNLNLILEKNQTSEKSYCPINLGVSFLDQSKSLEFLKKIELNNVAYPSIFLAFVSRASEIIGKNIMTIDMLRLKLSFFGALKFDPRSDKWLRICMFQGAPLPHELKNYDEQWVYKTKI